MCGGSQREGRVAHQQSHAGFSMPPASPVHTTSFMPRTSRPSHPPQLTQVRVQQPGGGGHLLGGVGREQVQAIDGHSVPFHPFVLVPLGPFELACQPAIYY